MTAQKLGSLGHDKYSRADDAATTQWRPVMAGNINEIVLKIERRWNEGYSAHVTKTIQHYMSKCYVSIIKLFQPTNKHLHISTPGMHNNVGNPTHHTLRDCHICLSLF